MFHFRKIMWSDRDWIQPMLSLSDFRAAEYSFANIFNWGTVFHIEAAAAGGLLWLRTGENTHNYLYPAGTGDLQFLLQQLLNEAQAAGQPLTLRNVPPEKKDELEAWFPGVFTFGANRDYADYVYLADDLIHLAGRKLQPKRNLISRFKKTYPDWQYEDITPDNLPECAAMNEEWCRRYGCGENHSLQMESCAVRCALQHYWEEQLLGGLLRVNGKVIAYTAGERLNSDTLIVHIEKAFGETYTGAYQVINQAFVARHAAGLKYVNREDDTGDEGLRKAKLSYRPAFLLEKQTAVTKTR